MLRVGCQTYTWEMLGQNWKGSVDSILDAVAQAGYEGIEITNSMMHGKDAVDGLLAQGVPLENARALLGLVVDQQAVMLATLNMFGVIAICLGVAAAIIWLVPKPQGPIDTSGAH